MIPLISAGKHHRASINSILKISCCLWTAQQSLCALLHQRLNSPAIEPLMRLVYEPKIGSISVHFISFVVLSNHQNLN